MMVRYRFSSAHIGVIWFQLNEHFFFLDNSDENSVIIELDDDINGLKPGLLLAHSKNIKELVL
jgi:hypothetical protein